MRLHQRCQWRAKQERSVGSKQPAAENRGGSVGDDTGLIKAAVAAPPTVQKREAFGRRCRALQQNAGAAARDRPGSIKAAAVHSSVDDTADDAVAV